MPLNVRSSNVSW